MAGPSYLKQAPRSSGIPARLLAAARSSYGAQPVRQAPVSPSLRDALGSAPTSGLPPAGLTPRAAALTGFGNGQLDIAGLLATLKSLQAPSAAAGAGAGGSLGGGPQGASGASSVNISAPSGHIAPGRANGLIVSLARRYGVDPAAALAVASQEGLGGGIGDNQTSFGPWQEHIGGALPANIGRLGPQRAQEWAWSRAGLEHAIRQIAGVSRGLHGQAAIEAIVRLFERPANPGREIAGASRAYGRYR